MSKRNRFLIAVLALLVPAGAFSAARAAGGDLVLATVNGEAVTLKDLRDAFGGARAGHANLLAGEVIIRQVVDNAVDQKLLIQEGRRKGLHKQSAFETAIEVYRDSLLVTELEKRHLEETFEPGDEAIRKAYDLLHRQVRIGLIETLGIDGARSARLRVSGGEAFDAVARQMSIHGSRGQGGDLGWVTWGMLDPVTETVALGTPVGAVSEPYEVDGGRYRIVRVAGEQAGHPPAWETAEGRIRAIIASRARHERRMAFLAEIAKDHPPTMDGAAIRKLVSNPDPGPAGSHSDPNDGTVLFTTQTGLPISAGYVRDRARRSGLSLQAAWDASRDDALLIDEARRRITVDDEIRKKIDDFAEQKLLAEIETASLKERPMTEEAVRAVYDADPDAFAGPASVHIRHIVLSTREEADEVHRLLLGGGDFGLLVKERSIDLKTKAAGGDLGWIDVPADDSADDTLRAILALAPGQFTGVMKTKLGYAIVQVLGTRPPLVPPYEQVREAAARMLFAKRMETIIAGLRKGAAIQMHEENIARAIEIQETLAKN